MSDCVFWDGKKRKDGRGYEVLNGKIIDAHRFVYEKKHGKLEKGISVWHTCKNKFCVNLEHLKSSSRITPLKERFLKYVNIPSNDNLCWIWNGNKDKDGYGVLKSKELKTNRANRISYALYNGILYKDMLVCHSCDNPSCVNPKHLWLGSLQDNIKDREIKNRRANLNPPVHYGKYNNKTKLTEEQVLEIRKLKNTSINIKDIANIYSISVSNIRCIWNGVTWNYL